jgi:uncharacterized phiE125 gp8 family phage protein
MPSIKINSTVGSEIVTVAEAKSFIRIDTSDDDTLLGTIIEEARLVCENYISADIVSKNRTYYLESANDRFEVPFSPITSISSVTVEGSAAAHTSYGANNEILSLEKLAAKDIVITYITTGINNGLLKQAILQLVSTLYDNRSDITVMQGISFVKIPTDVKTLLSSMKNPFI